MAYVVLFFREVAFECSLSSCFGYDDYRLSVSQAFRVVYIYLMSVASGFVPDECSYCLSWGNFIVGGGSGREY